MTRNRRIAKALAVAGVILALPLQCAQARQNTTRNATNTTIIYEYNAKLSNIAYTVTVIVFILLVLFFLFASSILYNRRSDSTTRSSRRGQIGISQAILNTFPTFAYSEVKAHKIGKSALECAICLNEFDDEETLRLIPKCDHVFHPECIGSWLGSHTTCPVCRANLDEPTTPEATGTFRTAPDQSGPSSAVDSGDDEATAVEIGELKTAQPEPTGGTKSPNRLMQMKTSFFYSKLSKSHSTGHFLVQSDRFTLILPSEIRDQIMNRALNRSNSDVVLPMESSLRKGYRFRTGGEEGSGQAGCTGPIGFGLFGRGGWIRRPNWNYNTGEGEGTSRFMGFVGQMPLQKLGLRRN